MELRDYQSRAVDSVYSFLRKRDDNPCVVIPTGGGKTPVIARICRDSVKEWDGRVIVLAHVRELLEQSFRHLKEADPELPVGIYSAGLGEKNPYEPVTVAGIQSAYRKPEIFEAPNLIIIDEAHRIPPDGEGMYRTFLEAMKLKNPEVRLIGFTATPYRTGSGMICGPDNLLNEVCFEVGIPELIHKGFLCKLKSKGGTVEQDFSSIHIVNGDFAQDELESLMGDEATIGIAVADLLGFAKDRQSILLFACGIKHGAKVAQCLKEQEAGEVAEVYGDTPSEERHRIIRDFREGKIRWLVNRDVLTLGFDAPNVDCIALLRATKSPGLYYQMVGRGFRIHPSKKDCLVMDFGGNILRHGPVDDVAPRKNKIRISEPGAGEAPVRKCPECHEYVPINVLVCPECGYQFPIAKHEKKATEASVLSEGPEEVEVLDVSYRVNEKKKPEGLSRTLRVDYDTGYVSIPEFVCLEHKGYPREKAVQWWRRRSVTDVPLSVDEAVERASELIKPKKILVKPEGKYWRIISYQF